MKVFCRVWTCNAGIRKAFTTHVGHMKQIHMPIQTTKELASPLRTCTGGGIIWPRDLRLSSLLWCSARLRTLFFSKFYFIRTVKYLFISCLKTVSPWCLIITSANVDRFSKFFHQLICKKLSTCTLKDVHLTCTMLLHYLTILWKSKIHMCQSYYETLRGILFWDTV